jgi:dihydroorotase
VNEDTLTLVRETPDFPPHIDTPDGPVTVFDPAMPLHWTA